MQFCKINRKLMKIKNILSLLCLTLIAGCSAGEDESNKEEKIDSIQQAADVRSGTCSRPSETETGDPGDQTPPFNEYVTGIHVGSSPWLLDIETTFVSSGFHRHGTITFGVNQANITGPGWSGDKLEAVANYEPTDSPCWANNGHNTNIKCIRFDGHVGSTFTSGFLFFDKTKAAANGPSNLALLPDSTIGHVGAVTKIRGYGRWDPQTLKFYYDDNGALGTYSLKFSGIALNACTDPYQ
jgi:hypothetical protein